MNEAFAAQFLSVEKELGLDRERTNVNRGPVVTKGGGGGGGANILVGGQVFQAVSEIFSLPRPNISAFLKYLVRGDRIFQRTKYHMTEY